MTHPAILCHGVHLHLPGTTDELGDDHWVLLDDKQQQIFNSVNRSRMQYLILNFNCSLTSVFRWGQSLLHKWVDEILKLERDREQNGQEAKKYGHRPRKWHRNTHETNARHSKWHHNTANLSQQLQLSIIKHNLTKMKIRITDAVVSGMFGVCT